MTEPVVSVEMAFGQSPLAASPAWTDVTSYVTGIESGRGRNTEIDAVEAGSVTLTLDNEDGTFTPRATPPANVTVRRNEAYDPSFEYNLAPGGGTGFTYSRQTTYARSGASSCRVVVTGVSILMPVFTAEDAGVFVSVGQSVTASVYARMASGTSPSQFQGRLVWYNGSESVIGTTNGPALTITADWSTRFTVTGTCPAGAVKARFFVASSAPSSAQTFYLDDALIEKAAAVGEYFDGDTGVLGNWWESGLGSTSAQGTEFPLIRPRTPVRVRATYGGTTYPIAQGAIERWPLSLSNGTFSVTVPGGDVFRTLAGITFGNSDTGQIEKFQPVAYFSMQEAKAPLFDSRSGFTMTPYWDGYLTAVGTGGNPLPVVAYQAASLLPSGSGYSVNLGNRWTDGIPGGAQGGWALLSELSGQGIAQYASQSITAQFLLPALPTGFDSVIIAKWGWGDISVFSDGTLNAYGLATGPIIEANKSYRVSASYNSDTGIVNIHVNGDEYSDMPGVSGSDANDYFTVGGYYHTDSNLYSAASGGRYSHAACWNRALTITELRSLWSDTLCAPGMKANTRINTLLDYCGWPTAARSIDTGLSTLNRESFSDSTSALSLLQKWAADDGGTLWAAPDGKVRFKNRNARVNVPLSYTVDVDALTAPEAGLEFVMDEDDIKNVVAVDVQFGVKATLRDEASIALYGEKPAGITLDIQDSNEGLAAGRVMLQRYAEPITRVSGLQLFPSSRDSATLWQICLGADTGQLLRLANLPTVAPATTMDFFIEAVRHSIVRDGALLKWSVFLDISPSFGAEAWVLGNSTLGVLGSTTKLYY